MVQGGRKSAPLNQDVEVVEKPLSARAGVPLQSLHAGFCSELILAALPSVKWAQTSVHLTRLDQLAYGRAHGTQAEIPVSVPRDMLSRISGSKKE